SIWDIRTGAEVVHLKTSTEAVAFSPDGAVIATPTPAKTVILWDAATGTKLRTLEGHEDSVHAVAFSPDGQWLASGGSDGIVNVWDATSGACVRSLATPGKVSVISLAFSRDSRKLAAGCWQRHALVWEVATGRPLAKFEGHSGAV